MTQHSDDLVKVRVGALVQVQAWGDLLQAVGIEFRVVGDNLTAGLGAALPDSIELWVHRTDAAGAESVITGTGGHHRREPESHPIPLYGHPESDPKPTALAVPSTAPRPLPS